jgi:ANTAR domain-containing protein/GAF domain-containing protein
LTAESPQGSRVEAVMADLPSRDAGPDAAETRLNRLLNLILEAAVEALGFDAATVSARHGDDLATIGATDQRLVALDEAQYESGAGPCISVLDPHDPIYLEDVTEEADRWEHFVRTAKHLGVRSSLSLHVPSDLPEAAASLNLYARRERRASDKQIRHAETFAEQLAATMLSVEAHRSTAKLAQQLAEAMRSRAVIEQAKGILRADHRLTDEEAFERLVQLSQHSNLKLREVARLLVEERAKPLG